MPKVAGFLPSRSAFHFRNSFPQGTTTYVNLIGSLDPQVIDYKQAVELPGWADMWVHDGRVYVSNGEAPSITRYAVSDTGRLIEEKTVSFASYGLTSAALPV